VIFRIGLLLSASILMSCSSSLKNVKVDQLKKNKEFEEAVTIEIPTPTVSEEVTEPAPEVGESPAATPKAMPKSQKKTLQPVVKKSAPKPKVASAAKTKSSTKTTSRAKGKTMEETVANAGRQPEIEDSEGFDGRRPIVDPFRVGEEVVHNVHYFKVSAGELKMKVEPFSTVNGRKSYTFAIEIKTSPLFSNFYRVQDRVETFVDYEDLVPRVFQLHVNETNSIRESKMLFDLEKNEATFWEKKVTKEKGEEEKKEQWEILPFSQNVYSAIFYMRNFKWETGKEYSFRVANEKENLVFSGKAIRREVLDTKLGPMKAIVIQPNIVLKGKFKPIGDNYIWVSDDDRKLVLRIESKIKIGTLVSEVIKIK